MQTDNRNTCILKYWREKQAAIILKQIFFLLTENKSDMVNVVTLSCVLTYTFMLACV